MAQPVSRLTNLRGKEADRQSRRAGNAMDDIDRLEDSSLPHQQPSQANADLPLTPLQGSPPASRANERDQPNRLRPELDRLEKEKHDLQIELLASNDRGVLLQEHLAQLSTSLTAEVRERHTAEDKLQKLIQAITREKGDLEILVQILMDQGDDSAQEGEKARIDGLTQIANRRRFDEYLLQEWGRHIRMQKPLSLLMCDVDHFKLYNDRHGHQAGDECLKSVAKVLSQCYRAGDLVARYGGEEFAMVLPQTNRAGAVQVAERVRAAVAAAALPHTASPVCDRVTVSIGVACITPRPNGPTDARTLVEEADRHLYLAKHRGRNQVSCEDEENTAQ
jgi:diguanylate cyclase (GGDEF)-like protein